MPRSPACGGNRQPEHALGLLLIDLKLGKLTHHDVGQMISYVRLADAQGRTEGDGPTIGLILCAEKNEAGRSGAGSAQKPARRREGSRGVVQQAALTSTAGHGSSGAPGAPRCSDVRGLYGVPGEGSGESARPSAAWGAVVVELRSTGPSSAPEAGSSSVGACSSGSAGEAGRANRRSCVHG